MSSNECTFSRLHGSSAATWSAVHPSDAGGGRPLLCDREGLAIDIPHSIQRSFFQLIDDVFSCINTPISRRRCIAEEAEERLRELGSTWEWVGENGDDLKTITSVLPALRQDDGNNRTNEQTFFNSMVAAYVGWNDSRNSGKDAVRLGDGSPCDEDAMLGATEIMDEIACALQWRKNDFVLLDNRTVMHARKPFEGKRRVLASLIRDHER